MVVTMLCRFSPEFGRRVAGESSDDLQILRHIICCETLEKVVTQT
jgi:hypothetical protein